MQVVLQPGVDVLEDVARDERERDEHREGDQGSRREHRERGTHHLADLLALTTSIGIGDEPGDTSLKSEVGDAQVSRGD